MGRPRSEQPGAGLHFVPASPDDDLCMTSSSTGEAGEEEGLRAGRQAHSSRVQPRQPLPISPSPQDRGPMPPEPEHPLPAHLQTPRAPERDVTQPAHPGPAGQAGPPPKPLLAQPQTQGSPHPSQMGCPSRGDTGAPSLPAAPAPGLTCRAASPGQHLQKPARPHRARDAPVAVGRCMGLVASLIP